MVYKNRRLTYKRKPRKYTGKKAYKPYKAQPLRIGIPYSKLFKLRYVTNFVLDGSAGIAADHVFRINDLYDPDFTGVGHQPRYFDQIFGNTLGSGMYKHFVVLGTKATIMMANSDVLYSQRVGATVRDSSTALTSANDCMEAGNSTTRLLGQRDGKGSTTMTIKWSAKKWFGKPNVTTERDLQGSNVGSPAEQAYLHVWTEDPGNDPAPVQCYITLDYIVLARSPVVAAQS